MRVRLGLVLVLVALTLGVSSTPRLLDSSTALAQDLPTDPVTIDVWWWGETEAPGLGGMAGSGAGGLQRRAPERDVHQQSSFRRRPAAEL